MPTSVADPNSTPNPDPNLNPDPYVFGLLDLDPDPLVTDMDPDPSIVKLNSKKTLDSYCFVTFLTFNL
jgi:hypothetical protein